MFSLKIVTVDHYQASPIPGVDVLYSDFRGSEINTVPVIRIFGVTEKGQKACLHVHGVFPYISIPFDGGGDDNPECFMQQLCLSIEKALNIASGKSNAHMYHIYKISVISGIPFYGYHEKKEKFFRIFFYNPQIIKKVVELLQMGAIMNQILQPYEAHIPFILQFFIDYNLYGMSTIDVSKIKFRLPLNTSVFMKTFYENNSEIGWEVNNLPSDMMLDAGIERLTYCQVEGDCSSEDILNRKLDENLDMNPGLKFIWEEECQRQKIRFETIQLTPVPSQKRDYMELTENEVFYKNRLRKIIEMIPELKNNDKEISSSEEICVADGESVKCTPAGVVEIHTSFSQGKETFESALSGVDTKNLTQVQLNDKSSMQNSSMCEDKEFLEMIISMIGNQNYSTPTDIENAVINQQSSESIHQKNYSDIEDELEMSLCMWDETMHVGSEVISTQNKATVILDKQSNCKASNSRESNLCNKEKNIACYSIQNSNAKDEIENFTIPQIDGMHDATSQSYTTTESIGCSRREVSHISVPSPVYSAASEAPWMQTTYTSSICDQRNFCYSAYTQYNQSAYPSASTDQYSNYSVAGNQSASTNFSGNSFNNNNREWLHGSSNSSAFRTLQSDTDACIPFTVLSDVSAESSINDDDNEKKDVYKHITKQIHVAPTNCVFPGQIASTGIKDNSFYQTNDTEKFSTIDTKILTEDNPKVVIPHKSPDYLTKLPANCDGSFDVIKKIEINNIGTQMYPYRVGGLLSMKTKVKSVCSTSTQTNIINSKSSFHQEEKIEEQRKSNPRTLVVQHMRRLKLSLSKNYCHGKKEDSNDEHSKVKCSNKSSAYSQENLSVVQKLATNLRPYPFIHRHAPKVIRRKKVQTDKTIVLSSLKNPSLSSHIAKGIVLPSYVKKNDLNKIGKEKVMLKRLESDIIGVNDKNEIGDQTAQHINNAVKKTSCLPVLTVNFKMSELKTWNKMQKLERQTKSVNSQSISHHIRKNVSRNSLSSRCKEKSISFGQNYKNNVTCGVAVNKYKKEIELEDKNYSATTKMPIENENQIGNDFATNSSVEKPASRIAKGFAVSKLSKNYVDKTKSDNHNVMQSSDFISSAISKETGNPVVSSLSKLSRKHNKSTSKNCNYTDGILSTNISINKTRKNSKRARSCNISELYEANIVETLSSNSSNDKKTVSSFNVSGKKKQIVPSCVNNFITKFIKQNDDDEVIREICNNNDDKFTCDPVVGTKYNTSKFSPKNSEKLNSLSCVNQVADSSCITSKSSLNNRNKKLSHVNTMPLKLTIKLPNFVRHTRVKKKKHKNTSGFQAFHPSPCRKSLIPLEDKNKNSEKAHETRPKRPNVDYKAYAYTHLLEFDKMVELPYNKAKKCHNSNNINDLAKRCRKLEIRVERLKPELLSSMSLKQKDCLVPHHKSSELNHNFKEKTTKLRKEGIYQCLNVFPISVDTNDYLQRQNNSPESNFTDDNLDVMWNLSYLSPSSYEHNLSSPPQCWSPYVNTSNESSRDSEQECVSEQLIDCRCSDENLHSTEISVQDKYSYNAESTESDSLMFLPSTDCTTVQLQDCGSSADGQTSKFISDKALPCNNASDCSLAKHNIEKCSEKDYNKISLNSSVSVIAKEVHSSSLQSQGYKELVTISPDEYISDTVNICKNSSEEKVQLVKPEANFNGQDDDKISNDYDNHKCYNFSQKYNENKHIISDNINFPRSKLVKNDNTRDNSNTFSTIKETNLVYKRMTCKSAEASLTFDLNGGKCCNYQGELCENMDLAPSAENTEVGTNLMENEVIKETSSMKNLLVQSSTDLNLKTITETETSGKKNGAIQQNQKIFNNELYQNISHCDANLNKQSNTKNSCKKTELLVSVKDGNYNKHSSNPDKTVQLCSTNTQKKEKNSLVKTDRDFPNTVLSENVHITQDQYYDEKEVKEDNFLIMQDTFNAFNFIKSVNNTELSQCDKLNLNKTISCDIFSCDNSKYSDNAKCKECEKDFYTTLSNDSSKCCDNTDQKMSNQYFYKPAINVKEKQTEFGGDSFCGNNNNNSNKQYNNTAINTMLGTKFIDKYNFSADIKNTKMDCTNDNLSIPEKLDNVKTSSNVNINEMHTSQDNSEINSSTGNCDSPPLSPEEKVIYDSQGNIMSSSTRSSQYSLCLGNHDIPQDSEISFENCSKILDNRSNISEHTLSKKSYISNQNQEMSKRMHDYTLSDKVLSEQQTIQDAIPYKSMFCIMDTTQQTYCKNPEQAEIAEVSKEVHLETENEYFKEENCRQLFSESCLIHNNPLEAEFHNKNSSMLLGPFEEVSFVFHPQSNSADETNALSEDVNHISEVLFDKNKLTTHIHQNNSCQTEIVNVSCKMSNNKDKNTIPLKLYQDECCKSVIQPIFAKSKNVQEYNTTDLAVNIESKNNDQNDKKLSDILNNYHTYEDVSHKACSEPHDTDLNNCEINNGAIIKDKKLGKIDDDYNKNIEQNRTELNKTEIKKSNSVNDTIDLTVNIESKNDEIDKQSVDISNKYHKSADDTVNNKTYLEPHDSDLNHKINNDATIKDKKFGKIDDDYSKSIEELNRTDIRELSSVNDRPKKETSDPYKNCCDILITKNHTQSLEKPSASLSCNSSSHKDHISDTTNIYFSGTSSKPQIDSQDDDLNEVFNIPPTDKSNNTNSDIFSFYATNSPSNLANTACNDKAFQLSLETTVEVNSRLVERKIYFPQRKPPTFKEITDTFAKYNIPQAKYQSAFYGVSSDSPKITSEFEKLVLKPTTTKIKELFVFEGMFQHIGLEKWQNEVMSKTLIHDSQFCSSFSMMDAIKNNLQLKVVLAKSNSIVLLPVKCPPSRNEIEEFLSNKCPPITQEEEKEKIPKKSWYENNPETVICSKKKQHKTTSVSAIEEIDNLCYQHSTPVEKQCLYIRKRRSSWSGSKPDGFSRLLKCRKISGDDASFCCNHKAKQKVPFIDISPIHPQQDENKIIHGEKRKMSFEFEKGKPDFDENDVTKVVTPNKRRIPIVRKKLVSSKSKHELLTLMSVEIHTETRRSLRPDPKYDPVKAVFFCINNDFPEDSNIPKEVIGLLIVGDQETEMQQTSQNTSQQNSFNIDMNKNLLTRSGITAKNATLVKDEISLLKKLIDVVREWNPDILCGYEIQMLSWGYLIQRAAYLNLNLCALLSRVPEEKYSRDNYLAMEKDYYSYGSMPELHITGRIVLNVWRLMRKELTLNTYTFENVVYHVLQQRIPCYSFLSLTRWFNDQSDVHRWRVINFYVIRVKVTLRLLLHLDLISRTSTLARIFGIQFYEVLTRGSQFRVESMMLRSTKPLNYVPVSPSAQKRQNAKAPECFPLIMEPESMFYTDPVVVLDFQSLYPSMIIAHNYCYSTCLGHVSCLGQNTAFEFGCSSLIVPPMLLKKLENDISVSPNGVAYVKNHIRVGVLPQMLQDILNTRIMVKNAMKECKDDKALHKLLDGRQLALKLIANVTYGYTGANYSGRMPCVEIADSIVAKARETLERAIRLVERTTEWNAKVVYGDTDSMFILLKGRSKKQAFKIGQEIAEAVTATNPKPVKLKLEKVYLPCVLQTKKRYVGFMYETPEQLEPVYDAKGIETIRRDSCPLVAKILEMSLKMLFTSKDLSLIKKYVQRQFQKILSGQTSVQDCIFAREYRGMYNYRKNACVPGLEIARRLVSLDPRAEPRIGERIPYVIVYGFPGLPLIQLVRQPQELFDDLSLRINAKYYITRVIIPPLHRVFSLIGVDVTSWYLDMPWTSKALSRTAPKQKNRGTLSQYLTVLNCPICNEANDQGICDACKKNPQYVTLILNNNIRRSERKFHHLSQICKTCSGAKYGEDCTSLDCPVLFKLYQATRDMSEATYYRELQHLLDF